MSQRPVDERRSRESRELAQDILGQLREISRSLKTLTDLIKRSEEKKDSERDSEIAAKATAPYVPLGTIRTESDFPNAFNEGQGTNQNKTHTLQKANLLVQIFLTFFTGGAFGAAAYYAHVAAQQKDTMEMQLFAMSATLSEIRRQSLSIERSAQGAIVAADAAKESNQINREAFASVQRAFVTAQMPSPVALTDASGNILSYQFQVSWNNTGTTPVRYAREHVSDHFWPGGPPRGFTYPDLGDQINRLFIIGAREGVSSAQMPVGFQIIKMVQNKQLRLYFWGWIVYLDMFKNTKPHVTEFCWDLATINGDIAKQGASVQFIYTHDCGHDCVDEQCENYGTLVAKWTPRPVTPTPR